MKALMKTTVSAKPSEVEKKWLLIDDNGLVVGRLASIVANILRGKHKPVYTPHIDGGDNDIIRSEEHTSELQSLRSISDAAFCMTNNKKKAKDIDLYDGKET